MVLCRYIELEFNSNCKCISNVDVDYSGYNDVIDLGLRRRDYYVDISVFSEVAKSLLVRGIGDVNADSKQESVIGRSRHVVK